MRESKAVVAVIIHENKVLVGKKKEDGISFLSGKWHIPGETLELEETDYQALVRGIQEEAGIVVKPGKYLATHTTPKHTEVKWFECEPETIDIVAGSDTPEVKWVPLGELFELCGESVTTLWPKIIIEYFDDLIRNAISSS
mgnify:CR=1 FL=1